MPKSAWSKKKPTKDGIYWFKKYGKHEIIAQIEFDEHLKKRLCYLYKYSRWDALKNMKGKWQPVRPPKP